MEILVVVAIFSVVTLILVNVFLLSLSSQRQTTQRQKTVATMRFVTETLAQYIRTNEIDYSAAYSEDGDVGISGSEQELYLRDDNDNTLGYFLRNGEIHIAINGQESPLTLGEDVVVTSLQFFISPQTNPFYEERCDDALIPINGCLPTVSCTVRTTDALPSQIIPTGYCVCTQDDQCGSGRCVLDGPSGVCLPFDQQPRVTISIGFESNSVKIQERKKLFFQTTVTSRLYQR